MTRTSLVAAALLVGAFLLPAQARDPDGQYANSPNHDWYLKAELTEAAQKRFGFKSCCAHSDVVRTKFRAGAVDGWDYWDGSKWAPVPQDIIHTDKSEPGGEPIMFAVGGRPTCFFPPLGGI